MSEALAAPQRIPRRVGVDRATGPDTRAVRSRHLELVDSDARRRARRRQWWVRLWAVGIVVAALTGVMVHALMAESQLRVAELETQIAAEQLRYEASRVQVAMGSTPFAIVIRARELGLVPAGRTRTVIGPSISGANAPTSAATATTPWETVKPNLGSRP